MKTVVSLLLSSMLLFSLVGCAPQEATEGVEETDIVIEGEEPGEEYEVIEEIEIIEEEIIEPAEEK